jgi:serine/threonine-protein kinase RsbW/stage II sporulation protein AB (anti-sigma F factor)
MSVRSSRVGATREVRGVLRWERFDTVNKPSAPALDLRLPAVPGAASHVRRAVHAVAAGKVVNDYAVALAVSEAVTNVVVHAYRDRDPDDGPGHVHVTVTVEGDELLVAVSDEGTGLTPRPDSPGAGLGLPIIATLADRFEARQLSKGTMVLLGFRLAAAPDGTS